MTRPKKEAEALQECAVLRALRRCAWGDLHRVVVAVSGGVDSMVLLHSVNTLFEGEIVVAHFNHRLRSESYDEAEFVVRFATQWGNRVEVGEASPRPQRANLEGWAREVRYRFLDECREKVQADAILTAHNKNDQAETLLFRFLSGRLANTSYAIEVRGAERRLLRPLLSVTREQIQEYAHRHSVPFVVDPSNTDLRRTRNRIRHRLLPHLCSEFNPNLLESLAEIGARLKDDEDFLWAEARKAKPQGADLSQVLSLSPAVQWRVLRLLAVEQVGEVAQKLSYRTLERLLSTIDSRKEKAGGDLGFGVRYRVSSRGELLFFSSKGSEKFQCSLPVPGRAEWRDEAEEGFVLEARWISGRIARERLTAAGVGEVAYFDGESLQGRALQVRSRRDGDQMRVWGRGARKVKKLFQERAIPRAQRDRYPVIEHQGEILWIPGVARGEQAPVTPDEERSVVELSCRWVRPER